jgi:hypothetical protein
MVACEQWNAGNDAGGGNQFIRRVGVEVRNYSRVSVFFDCAKTQYPCRF